MRKEVHAMEEPRIDVYVCGCGVNIAAAANVLTNAALDPIAKIPEYKVCAVKVQPVD